MIFTRGFLSSSRAFGTAQEHVPLADTPLPMAASAILQEMDPPAPPPQCYFFSPYFKEKAKCAGGGVVAQNCTHTLKNTACGSWPTGKILRAVGVILLHWRGDALSGDPSKHAWAVEPKNSSGSPTAPDNAVLTQGNSCCSHFGLCSPWPTLSMLPW